MKINVKVSTPAVTKMSKNQNPYTMQEVWAHLPNRPAAEPIQIFPDIPGGYANGDYTCDLSQCLSVRDGRLSINPNKLVPAAAPGRS